MPAGGANRGQGRKSQWITEDKTVRLTIQVPAGKAEEIKAKIEKILKPLRKKPTA
jgi:hypothetical protein